MISFFTLLDIFICDYNFAMITTEGIKTIGNQIRAYMRLLQQSTVT